MISTARSSLQCCRKWPACGGQSVFRSATTFRLSGGRSRCAYELICRDSVSAPTYCRVVGSISAYQTTSGTRYRAMFRKPDHAQTHKRGFETKREAELFLARVEIDKSRGAYIDPSKSRVLVGDWLDAWTDGRADWRATSRERASGIGARHIKPSLGGYPLGSLTHGAVKAWAGDLSKTQSPSSVRKIINVLSGSLQMAVQDGRLPANPAHGLNLLKVGKSAERYLSHGEVRDRADAVDSLGKGMYRGERAGDQGMRIAPKSQDRVRLSREVRSHDR